MNMQWLSSLRMLHHLDMSGVHLSKAIDWPFQVINGLPSLVQLHFSSCQLSHIHPRVSSLNLTSLSLLDLSENNFNSSLVPLWIFSITSLVSLDLNGCQFHGLIPSSIYSFRNLTSLESLYVSRNDFMNSSLVLQELSSSNLVSLNISSCHVSSSVLNSLHNLTSLLSLDLSQNQLTMPLPKSLGDLCNLRDIDLSYNCFLDTSLEYLLESVFECKSSSLESLSLWSSQLSGHLPNQLGQLRHLMHLQLYDNFIVGTIPVPIGHLSLLKTLCLHVNFLSGPIPYSIGRLSSLEGLYLSDNELNGSVPNSIGRLPLLKKLDISYNQLSGSLPDSVGKLSSLRTLDFSHNQLDGGLPNSIGRLSSLKRLDFSHNKLYGNLPESIGGLSSLEVLDLSYNQLNGCLPNSLGQLSKLELLSFSDNLLRGVAEKAQFAKLVSLTYLDGSNNNLTLRQQPGNRITPSLQVLYLKSWGLGPQFPLWLQSHSDLREVDISNTRISSPMPPKSFWKSLPNLTYLDMSQNHIQGTLLGIPATLVFIDLSFNKFSGDLPLVFPQVLDMSNNFLVGSLHPLLCSPGVKETRVLNLGNNQLSGVIPECWEKWQRLTFLNLENNSFSGEIPKTMGSIPYLESLNMHGNKISGRLPASLMNLSYLSYLQLGRNELVGSIPAWFGTNCTSLRLLDLRSNHFDQNIPLELCYLTYIHILDLADNNLSGNIPRCFDNFNVLSGKVANLDVQYIFYSGYAGSILVDDSLVMKGREDVYKNFLGLVMLLDLSSNNLSGKIPRELTSLRELRSLNLSRNQLIGRIPEKIGDIKLLETFDVSMNKLFGELPVSLSNLSSLSSFNVSYNNLTGKVPISTQLQTFNESSFFGNKLCGAPLIERCTIIVPRDDQKEDGSRGADWGLIISIVLGFVGGIWIVLAPLIISTSWRIAYFHFLSKCC